MLFLFFQVLTKLSISIEYPYSISITQATELIGPIIRGLRIVNDIVSDSVSYYKLDGMPIFPQGRS